MAETNYEYKAVIMERTSRTSGTNNQEEEELQRQEMNIPPPPPPIQTTITTDDTTSTSNTDIDTQCDPFISSSAPSVTSIPPPPPITPTQQKWLQKTKQIYTTINRTSVPSKTSARQIQAKNILDEAGLWRTPHNGNGIHFSIGSGIHTGMVANGGRELGSSGYYGGGYEFSIKSSSSSTSTRTSTNSDASTITPSSPSSK